MRAWIRRWGRVPEATCAEVVELLQSYLDGQLDDLTDRRVRRHLEKCRRCGLESETYQAIKDAIARRANRIDPDALARLRQFGERLAEAGPGESAGSSA